MAARTTIAEVKDILDDTELTDSVITAYITSASTMVDTVLGTGTSDILKEIERWLAAHMISSTRERMALKEGAGGASITYTGTFGESLNGTSYGQMVLALDTTGAFAALTRRSVKIIAVTSFE